MKCKKCGSEMKLDDVDMYYPNCKTYYFLCPSCDSYAIVETRSGEITGEKFVFSDGTPSGTA